MRCPTLNELPTPPDGKSGWPWTEGSRQPAKQPPAGNRWPRISIVTPAYNRAGLVEETIRSVLLQGYPDLEYIIIDGASTDGTVEVIRQYSPWLTYWVSEPDDGQSEAINKGLRKATGDVVAYINTDDLYTPGALAHVGRRFSDGAVRWLSAPGLLFGPGVGPGYKWPAALPRRKWRWLVTNPLCQSSTFWRRELMREAGEFDTELRISMDYEYWLRLLRSGCEPAWTSQTLSRFRIHSGSLTGAWEGDFAAEDVQVRARYIDMLTEPERRKVRRALPEARGRRLRWRAWRRACGGRPGGAAADLAGAVRICPRLFFSPKTLAAAGTICWKLAASTLRNIFGGGEEGDNE